MTYDVALPSSTKQHIQNKTIRMNKEARRVGLKIDKENTKVMRIKAKSQEKKSVDGQDTSEVETFNYLGATICKEGGGMKDIKNRPSKARGLFVRLKKIWNAKSISTRTKLRLYKTLVVPVLLYGCETWSMNKGDDKRIDVFYNTYLRRILRIDWKDHVTTQELLEKAGMKPLSKEVKRRRLKMMCHILRKGDCNDMGTGRGEKKGRPKTTLRWAVEKERKHAGWRSWEEPRTAATNREKWRTSVEALCATRRVEDR